MIPRSLFRVFNAGVLAGLAGHALWRLGPTSVRCYAELARPLLEFDCPSEGRDWALAIAAWAVVALVLAWPAALAARDLGRSGFPTAGVAAAAAPLLLGMVTFAIRVTVGAREGATQATTVVEAVTGLLIPALIVSLPALRAALTLPSDGPAPRRRSTIVR